LWGTYFGGNGGDDGYAIITDNLGNILITGKTESSTGIATFGSHQINYDGTWDAFIAKFDSSGSCIWGTYYGGQELDEGYGMASDPSGNVIVTGITYSTNGIITINAFQPQISLLGGSDAFVTKFNPDGIQIWGTYYGGTASDAASAIFVDANEEVFVTGTTSSNNVMATTNAHQINAGGFGDAFIVKFDSGGTRLWGTYYGGSNQDNGLGICVNNLGNVYMVGFTESTSAIATNGAFQTVIDGQYDGFIVKFQDDTSSSIYPVKDNLFSATLYPNPSSNYFGILINSQKEGIYNLSISDLSGRILLKDSGMINFGKNYKQFEVQDFIPGIYFVKLTIDGYSQTLKFCKD
jgi:hypothetical protein